MHITTAWRQMTPAATPTPKPRKEAAKGVAVAGSSSGDKVLGWRDVRACGDFALVRAGVQGVGVYLLLSLLGCVGACAVRLECTRCGRVVRAARSWARACKCV